MYEAYWGLHEKPFENTADPRFLYYSKQHEEAFTRLIYAIQEQKGAAVLSGVFGCGKTVVAQAVLSALSKGKYETAFVINPQLSSVELLREILYDLGLKDNLPTQKTDILHSLDETLHHNVDDGKQTIVIIDEAHLIEDRLIFEELRLLLNFQYKNRFLLTLILLGQPELREKINNIKQLAQRIAIKYYLSGLSEPEILEYMQHRLEVAGVTKKIFDDSAIKIIYEQSGGIPRRVNQICDMALLTGFGSKAETVSEEIIMEVVKDIES
ncbi:MAG: AAA family ATPase [Candidatus Omnitrophota bacterium]|nr:AAA family ATPase [Candidatus Omnitrophota bacterium]